MTSKLLVGACVLLACLSAPEARRKKERTDEVLGTREPESPPKWSRRMRQRESISKEEGSTFSLQCPADGNPKPNITWFRDAEELNLSADLKRLSGAVEVGLRQHKWSLRFLRPLASQSANYTCLVQNEHGALKWTFDVYIEAAGEDNTRCLGKVPGNQTVSEGGQATFECWPIAAKDNSLPVFWYKHYQVNGSYSAADGTPHVRELKETHGKLLISDPHILTVQNVTSSDVGWFTCFVGDIDHWVAHSSAWLAVATPTAEPVNQPSSEWNPGTEVDSESPKMGQSMDTSSRDSGTSSAPSVRLLSWAYHPYLTLLSSLHALTYLRSASC